MTGALLRGPAGADTGEGLPAGTRAVLIGTGHYDGAPDLPDLPAVPGTVTALRDVLVERCGVRPGNIVGPVLDPAEPADIGQALVRCAGAATDVLLVYYCGHGRVGTDSQLYLAASRTAGDNASLGFTGFSYQQLRQSLTGCQARTVVIVLDCCFAGRAADPAEGALAAISAPGAPVGGYLLASAAYSEAALAPLGEPHTAFGGALITLLADGIPDGPRLITLNEAYKALDRTLTAQGRPRPRSRSSGSAGELVLTANPSYQPPVSLAALMPAGAGDEGAPYLGLASYEESDARLFYGREALLAGLRLELAGQLDVPGPLIVLGSSGAGKSSLLRAGLRPSLDDGLPGAPQVRTWPKIVLTPGSDPVGALAAQLGGLLAADPRSLAGRLGRPQGLAELSAEAVRRHTEGGDDGGRRLVIIADQFEDVFGPGVMKEQRETFLTALDAATKPRGGDRPPAVLAVVGLRADFYGLAQSEPFLAEALLRKRTFDITAMTASEIRDVITKPAAGAGLTVEPELTDLILTDLRAEDLGSGAGYDTRLPLLSHALLATWRYREGSMLTTRGYQAAGGVSGAVAHSAGQLWARDPGQHAGHDGPQALREDEREIARRLLLQLVAVGPQGTGAARRRVPLPELAAALGAAPGNADRTKAVGRVLGKLVSARLVTVDRAHAEIIHDSLLRTWPQLGRWIEDERSYLVTGREATEAAARWDRDGRHLADLYSGSQLQLARQWASATGQIPALTAEFLRRSVRKMWVLRIGLGAAVIAALALITTFVAITKSDADNVQAHQAALESEQIAASANAILPTDPEAARDLALSAYHLSPTSQAAQALAAASVTPAPTELRIGGAGTPNKVEAVFSPDGALLAASSGKGKTVTLWSNPESGRPVLASVLHLANCSLAFIPGTRILTLSCDGVTTLWDTTRPEHPAKIATFGARGQPTDSTAVSSDGRWLATGGSYGLLQLWDLSDRYHARLAAWHNFGKNALISSVSFSADSSMLAVVANSDLLVADLPGRAPGIRLSAVSAENGIFTAAFSPQGRVLAAGNAGGPDLYDVSTAGHVTQATTPDFNIQGTPASLALSPNGQTIAMGLSGGGIGIGPVNSNDSASSYTMPSPGSTDTVAFSPDGRYLAGAGSDGIVRIWPVAAHPGGLLQSSSIPSQQNVSADGQLLVVSGGQGGAEIWNISDPARPVLESALGPAWAAASFAPYGRILMTMNTSWTEIQLWNLTHPQSPQPLGKPFHSDGGELLPDFSPYGRYLAIGDTGDGLVTVWAINSSAMPSRRYLIPAQSVNASVYAVFLGLTVVGTVNTQNTAVLLWNLNQPSKVKRLRPLPTPGGLNVIVSDSSCPTIATIGPGQPVQLWAAAKPTDIVAARRIGTPTYLNAGTDPITMTGECLLADAPNAGTANDIKIWDTRDPRSPRLITTLQTTGTVNDLQMSDDGTRVAALIENSQTNTRTLDVWSIGPSGTTQQLAAFPVNSEMDYSEFLPNSHLIVFNPAEDDSVLPDILNPDPASTYHSLCSTAQNVVSRSSWSEYVPPGIPYEPPC